ncbi:MAG: helix-turn-helix transcriptional regulator [bacterium]
MKRLHKSLRHWRLLHDLTQESVARELAISRPYVAAIERGYVPPLSLIEKISSLIGIAATELILDDGDAPGPILPEPVHEPPPVYSEAPAYTPVRQVLTTKGAIDRARRIIADAGFAQEQVPLNLCEFLCRREAAYLKVTPEELRIMATLRFKKNDTGNPEPEDYLDFLVTTLRPFIPKEP